MKNFLLLFVALTAMTLTNAQITSFPFEEDFEDFTACGAGGCNVDCSGAVANGWTQQINGVEDDQLSLIHI